MTCLFSLSTEWPPGPIEPPRNTHSRTFAAFAHSIDSAATALGWQDWADPILLKPYDIKDGLLHIPNVPGVGLEWNEDAITANAARL